METAERLKRWRLILGAESEDRFSKMQGSDGGGLGLSAEELMMDQALAAIYNQTSSGGFGNGPGGRGPDADRPIRRLPGGWAMCEPYLNRI